MGVANGQYANETTFNDAFMDRNVDTDTIGIVDLLNDDPLSGSHILNIQENINALCSVIGIPVNQLKNYLITWDDTSNVSIKAKINELLGSIQIKYPLTNNQSLTNIVGFILDKTTEKSAQFIFEIERLGTSKYRQIIQAQAVYDETNWSLNFGAFSGSDLAQSSLSSTEQVVLAIDSTTGQLKYSTGNLSGHTSSNIKVFQTRMKV